MSSDVPNKRLVILESPFAPSDSYTVADNIAYARKCLQDSLHRGEAPIASHLLYTQQGVLNDKIPDERKLGISAGHAWLRQADAIVVYLDHGLSSGMEEGIRQASQAQVPIEFRRLGEK